MAFILCIPSDDALYLFKAYENISDSFRTDAIFILNTTKKKNTEKGGVMVLFSAHYLMKLYICTKLHENINKIKI